MNNNVKNCKLIMFLIVKIPLFLAFLLQRIKKWFIMSNDRNYKANFLYKKREVMNIKKIDFLNSTFPCYDSFVALFLYALFKSKSTWRQNPC